MKFGLLLIVVLGATSCAHRPVTSALAVEDTTLPEFYQWATEEAVFRFERMAMPATASMIDCSSPELCDVRFHPWCRDLDPESSPGRALLARLRWDCERDRSCWLRQRKEARALRGRFEAALRPAPSTTARVSDELERFARVDEVVSKLPTCDSSGWNAPLDIAYEVLGNRVPVDLVGHVFLDGIAIYTNRLGRHGDWFDGSIVLGRHVLGLSLDSYHHRRTARIDVSYPFVPMRGRRFGTKLVITIDFQKRSPRIRVRTVAEPFPGRLH